MRSLVSPTRSRIGEGDFKGGYARLILVVLVFILTGQYALAIERRDREDRDDYTGDKETSYFVYPLIYTIPGIGSGSGAGATMVHLLGDDSTLSLIRIRGEFEIDGVIVTDIPLFTKHFTLSLAYANSKGGGFAFYDRGPDSSEEPEFTLKFNRTWARAADLNLKFFDGQLEFYSGFVLAFPDVNMDESDFGGNFDDFDNLSSAQQEQEIGILVKHLLMYFDLQKIFFTRNGFRIDYTDDRIDPRIGFRFFYERWGFEGDGLTNFYVDDYSLTTYIPNNALNSVWVFNVFFSKSEVTRALD